MNEITPTWGRDLAVLKAIYHLLQTEWGVSTDDLMAATGEDKESIFEAVMLLGGEHLFRMGGYVHVERASRTERGLREVGAWPSPESLAEALVKALDTLADKEPDPERKRSLKDLVKQIRPGHILDLVRAIQILMDTGVLPKLG